MFSKAQYYVLNIKFLSVKYPDIVLTMKKR